MSFVKHSSLMNKFSLLFERRKLLAIFTPVIAMTLTMLACARGVGPDGNVDLRGRVTLVGPTEVVQQEVTPPASVEIIVPPTVVVTVEVVGTPTPNAIDAEEAAASVPDQPYFIQSGDTYALIAERFAIPVDVLLSYNDLDPDGVLYAGDMLLIPNDVLPSGPTFKLIPDSELVYGPAAVSFDIDRSVSGYAGYLASFTEVDQGTGEVRTGSEIVSLVARRYSVNPRLLLALLEYQSGWLTNPSPAEETLTYPMGQVEGGREGLLRQLSNTANELNAGFYAHYYDNAVTINVANGPILTVADGVNAGTVAVQRYLGLYYEEGAWQQSVSPEGIYTTFSQLFGNPFSYTVDPLVPEGLGSPALTLPWTVGETWFFTGGPHGGWDSGSAWASVDFAPPSQVGCGAAPEWVIASADGIVVRSEDGAVMQDLDRDGNEQTGWVVFYMHIDAEGRVPVGTELKRGDRVGHPSCEGGFSSGTHLHFARKYNGVWISADDPRLPFNLDGYQLSSTGNEYDGYLQRGDQSVEAWNGRGEINAVIRN